MSQESTVFAQLMAHASRFTLDRCIRRYRGNHRVRRFRCPDQFLVMAFAQLTYRESLRDIEACLGAVPDRLYRMGIGHPVSRTTGSIYVLDRGYVDFARLYLFTRCAAHFVLRAKRNLNLSYSRRSIKRTVP